jgi:L-ascorbate metabolism protein UlaG (beta-lactamase superfamily)
MDIGGRVVLTDPVLTDRVSALRRVAGSAAAADRAGVDLVLLSHLHGDHLHLPSLRLLDGARIVVPRGAGAWLRGKGIRRVTELAAGEELVDGDLRVTGVPAAHSGHRWGPRSTRGPQAEAMGHLVEGVGATVYAAGDTDLFAGMADLPAPDVALLPVWAGARPWAPATSRRRVPRGPWTSCGPGSRCRCTGARSRSWGSPARPAAPVRACGGCWSTRRTSSPRPSPSSACRPGWR